MKKLIFGLLVLLPILAMTQPRPSPHDKASITIGKTNITMEFGRPFLKGRHVGGELAPYGEVWRTGADEATNLVTDGDIMVGDLKVPKGKYTIFTLPTKTGWTLIVNKIPEQWGAFNYSQDKDLGRTKMTVTTVKEPVEQFTLLLAKSAKGATLKLLWDTTIASVGITEAH